jgi:long-chain acyl-CoA synthetase
VTGARGAFGGRMTIVNERGTRACDSKWRPRARNRQMNVSTARQDAPTGCRDFIGSREAGTVWGLFCERQRRSPDRLAYRDWEAAAGQWRDHTWRSVGNRVDRFRSALAGLKLNPGDRVGILLPNGIDWISLDLAAHAGGLVVVALYPHDSPGNQAYILGHADVRLLLLDSAARWQTLCPFRPEFSALEAVWICGGVTAEASESAPVLRSLADVLGDAPPPPPRPAGPGALATLIYTSGTTGRPKGVMLSHYALLWNAEATAQVVPPRSDDVFLSVLPLAHAFERTLGYYLPMMGGSAVAHARTPQDPRGDLGAVRPTVLLAVPRLFERVFAVIQRSVGSSVVKRGLMRLTALLGWQRVQAAQRQRRPAVLARLLWPVLDRLVATPVRAAFGGRMRVLVSGGAPLDPEICRFLLGLGLPLVEGYGLTEAAPVVTATRIEASVPGSVGRPLAGIDLTITAEGELLVRTPAVMLGYWKDVAGTQRALKADHWLATGDLAEISDGHMFLRGRVDEMIALSIGEKVNPSALEAEITRDPLFDQAAVLGHRRPFLSALVVLNREEWDRFAEANGDDPAQPNAPTANDRILARIGAILSRHPRHAQVRAVHPTLDPWTIKAGLVTPTLKIKRDAVQRLFTREIEALYETHRSERAR